MHQCICSWLPSPPSIPKLIVSNHSPPSPPAKIPCNNMKDLHQLHSQLIKTGLTGDTAAINQVLTFSATSPSGDTNYALLVFSRIQRPNAYAWNTIIRGFSRSSAPLTAIALFIDMLHSPTVPGRLTFPSLFTAYSHLGMSHDGTQLHGMSLKHGFSADPYVRNAMISMYASCGDMAAAARLFGECVSFDVVSWNSMIMGLMKSGHVDDARRLFDDMPERSIVTWSTMVSGYVRNGWFQEALDLFLRMQEEDIEPNERVMASLLGACACLGALEQGEWIHDFIKKHRIEVNPIVTTALIDMYCKCGSINMALRVFESVSAKGVSSCNSIIYGLAIHGHGEEAIKQFRILQSSGLKPDSVSFVGILTACNHSGMVEEARKYFSLMTDMYGIKPTIEHYGCMVDILGRAGLLEEAEEMIRTMPIDPDAIIWGSLLSACRNQGNREIGERAAKRIIQLDPGDSGGYILLADALASNGDFDNAMNVRMMMKEKMVSKKPGCSMIEVDGVIHEFVIGGKLHPQAKEVHALLGESV